MHKTLRTALASTFAVLALFGCGGSDGGTGTTDAGGDPADDAAGAEDLGSIDTNADTDERDGSADDAGPDVVEGAFGTACEGDEDCLSSYCIPSGRDGAQFCTQQCTDDCPTGFVCAPIASAGGDRLFLCLPDDDPTCTPCETALDCGSLTAACLPLVDGDFCIADCGPGGFCPDGTSCQLRTIGGENRSICLPPEEVCGGCYDPDNDGYGIGEACLGDDCDQGDPLTYEGASELCDLADNDCDLDVDEDFNLATDRRNCGACGVSCDADNSRTACVASECVINECVGDFVDCDLDASTGCERAAEDLNSCGGCALLEGEPSSVCGTCGTGRWQCNGLEDVRCVGDAGPDVLNACGGCTDLEVGPGEVCGTCDSGVTVCDGSDGVLCAGDEGEAALNACGGCATLTGVPDTACGTCGSGFWVCDGTERVSCLGDRGAAARNACGGCDALDNRPGEDCGSCETGTWICASPNALSCAGDLGDAAINACGGCTILSQTPETPCGTCGSGEWTCNGTDTVTCVGDRGGLARNACGGCTALEGLPEASCGTCNSGRWGCNGLNDVECVGDLGAAARNACGGCEPLTGRPGQSCGTCGDGTYTCLGPDVLECQGATTDSDGDTVCDSTDICPGGDDRVDGDRDGVPDFCDQCPEDNPDDIDRDGVCNSDDICPGGNDRRDTDFDGVPNDCDRCTAGNDAADFDRDGIPDACDCDSGLCDSRATCQERSSGVLCACISGYTGTGRRCEDVDECDLQIDDCDANYGVCENTDGSYECSCLPGYDGTGLSCSDVDECLRGTDACVANSTCQNVVGGYLCPCNDGYSGNGLLACTNTNECDLGTDLCHPFATCTDASPGYICQCRSGYRGNGFTCTDIDECDEGTDACDLNATCSNTAGTYGCACNSGYTGDGFSCTPTGTTLFFPLSDEIIGPNRPQFGNNNDSAYTVRAIEQTQATQALINLNLTANNLTCALRVVLEVNDAERGEFLINPGQFSVSPPPIGFLTPAVGPEYRIRYQADMALANCGLVTFNFATSTIRLVP